MKTRNRNVVSGLRLKMIHLRLDTHAGHATRGQEPIYELGNIMRSYTDTHHLGTNSNRLASLRSVRCRSTRDWDAAHFAASYIVPILEEIDRSRGYPSRANTLFLVDRHVSNNSDRQDVFTYNDEAEDGNGNVISVLGREINGLAAKRAEDLTLLDILNAVLYLSVS